MKEKDLEPKDGVDEKQKEEDRIDKAFNKFIDAGTKPEDGNCAQPESGGPEEKVFYPSLHLDDQIVPDMLEVEAGSEIEIVCKCNVKRIEMDDDGDGKKSLDLEIKKIRFN